MYLASAKVAITKIHDDAQLPTLGTSESIGADVYAYLKTDSGRTNKLVIPPNTTRAVPTGIVAFAQPPFSLFVASRSGMAMKALFVTNAPGIIDPDYRGEIKILLHNGGVENQWIEHGYRIAQLVLVPCPTPLIVEATVDIRTLVSTRGENGFGSTGV